MSPRSLILNLQTKLICLKCRWLLFQLHFVPFKIFKYHVSKYIFEFVQDEFSAVITKALLTLVPGRYVTREWDARPLRLSARNFEFTKRENRDGRFAYFREIFEFWWRETVRNFRALLTLTRTKPKIIWADRTKREILQNFEFRTKISRKSRRWWERPTRAQPLPNPRQVLRLRVRVRPWRWDLKASTP